MIWREKIGRISGVRRAFGMKLFSALTPALSPRRGSAEKLIDDITFVAAFVAFPDAENRFPLYESVVVPPLLGERVGVRASQFIL